MAYTVGSLFAGIGGIDLGFERAGFRTSWQVEIDPYCQKVLAKNFPHAERFDDVRTVGRHNLAPVDVIVGGFPCQDLSGLGKRAGLDGDRSGLWREYARIVSELRPRFILVENVAALLVNGMGRVIGDLASLGYDSCWRVLPASSFGAPHQRERIFILAYPLGERLEGWLEEWSGLGTEALSQAKIRWNLPAPFVCGSADGVPRRVDRLKGLGNAVVPQIPELFARRIHAALERAA